MCCYLKTICSSATRQFRLWDVMNHSVVHLGHDAPWNRCVRLLCNQTGESWDQPDHLVTYCQHEPPVCWWCITPVVTVQPVVMMKGPSILKWVYRRYAAAEGIYGLYHAIRPTDDRVGPVMGQIAGSCHLKDCLWLGLGDVKSEMMDKLSASPESFQLLRGV